jgi:hypothetical protein
MKFLYMHFSHPAENIKLTQRRTLRLADGIGLADGSGLAPAVNKASTKIVVVTDDLLPFGGFVLEFLQYILATASYR